MTNKIHVLVLRNMGVCFYLLVCDWDQTNHKKACYSCGQNPPVRCHCFLRRRLLINQTLSIVLTSASSSGLLQLVLGRPWGRVTVLLRSWSILWACFQKDLHMPTTYAIM